MTAVYVAAPYLNRAGAVIAARRLRDEGHQVVSRWHDRQEETDLRAAALADLADIQRAQVLLHLDLPAVPTPGRWFETGYAHALGLRVVVVQGRNHPNPGPDGCLFLALPRVRVVPDFAAAVAHIGRIGELAEVRA